jgi:TonB family protein
MPLRTASFALCAAACALACAPSPVVVVLEATPRDAYAPDPLPHDASDAIDASARMELPPEALIPVGGFLADAHGRLHRSFTEGTLVGFERAKVAAKDVDLETAVELAVAADDGRVVDVSFASSSGVIEFDAAAMHAVLRASPLAPPPPEIVGPSRQARLVWRFRRRAVDPCGVDGASLLPGWLLLRERAPAAER